MRVLRRKNGVHSRRSPREVRVGARGNGQGSLRCASSHLQVSFNLGRSSGFSTRARRGGWRSAPRASACTKTCKRLDDLAEHAFAAHRRAGSRTRRDQCKPVEVGRRDRLLRCARLRRPLRALRRVHESTTDGARRRTSSRRTYFDRGLALKARSEMLAGEFASMTAVPTISGSYGGRHHLPQDLRGEAREPGTRRRPATRRRFRGRFRCPRRVFSPTRKRCRRAVFLAGPSRMIMPTCARPFRAPETTPMASRKCRFWLDFL